MTRLVLSHQIDLNQTGNRRTSSAEAKQTAAEKNEQWFSHTPLDLFLSPLMARFPWDSKDLSGATDNKDSNLDPNLSGSSPETTRLGEWSTSRRELWCFYLYYVVRSLFFGGGKGRSFF
jgi:hypothetical protein